MDVEQLRQFCLAKPGATEDLPFGPETLVLKIGGKMFALIPLDLVTDQTINLKCEPERAAKLREEHPDSIKPGYHMNKQHWNTVHVNAGLSLSLLAELINHSYELVLNSLPKSVRADLAAATR